MQSRIIAGVVAAGLCLSLAAIAADTKDTEKQPEKKPVQKVAPAKTPDAKVKSTADGSVKPIDAKVKNTGDGSVRPADAKVKNTGDGSVRPVDTNQQKVAPPAQKAPAG